MIGHSVLNHTVTIAAAEEDIKRWISGKFQRSTNPARSHATRHFTRFRRSSLILRMAKPSSGNLCPPFFSGERATRSPLTAKEKRIQEVLRRGRTTRPIPRGESVVRHRYDGWRLHPSPYLWKVRAPNQRPN